MRYELSAYDWSVIRPRLQNKPRGIPRVDDRRILNCIFWACTQAHHGVICQTAMVPLRLVITALFAGDGLASGTRSWMRWRWLTMRICRRTGSVGEHPTQVQSQGPDLLQPLSLPRPQPGGAVLQQDQAVSARRDPIRQARRQLPRFRQARLHPPMAARL